MKTNQEIFDRVVTHLRTQNARAKMPVAREVFQCMYRAPNGLKCAVGCLIPDDKYTPDMDGVALVPINPVWNVLIAEGIDMWKGETEELLKRLQRTHDTIVNLKHWELHFAQIAKDFNLTYMEPK